MVKVQISKDALYEVAFQHSRMVECAIRTQEKAKAHAAVDRAFASLSERSRSLGADDLLTHILTPRMVTILAGAGILTVGNLCEHSRDSLAQVHQIRYRSVSLIEDALAKHGFSLRKN